MSVLSNKKGNEIWNSLQTASKKCICFSHQVVSPLVDLDESNVLKLDEWLCDII